MVKAARRVEASSVEALLIVSNTRHKAYDDVAAAVFIPVLHIAKATADRLVANSRERVALLGTRFTMTEDYV